MSTMKKKALVIFTTLALACTTALSGCGNSGYDFAGSDLSAYITLPSDLTTHDYSSGLTLKGEVTDEDIQEAIDKALEELAEPVDLDENATVEDGDTVVMDYVGKLDGEAFEGGSATDSSHEVLLENSTFIDGFDAGLVGMKAGETKDLNLTFPDPYEKNPDLAGKAVVFTVTIDSIERTKAPELTDTLVTENPNIFGKDISTADAYREQVKKDLKEGYEAENKTKLINAAWKDVLESSTYTSYPDGLVDEYTDTLLDYYEHTVAAANEMHLKEYVKEQGYESVTAFKEAVVIPEAEDIIKEKLALYAAAKATGVSVTNDEAKAQAQTQYDENIAPSLSLYSSYFGISNFEDYLAYIGGIDSVKEGILFDRAFEIITGTQDTAK